MRLVYLTLGWVGGILLVLNGAQAQSPWLWLGLLAVALGLGWMMRHAREAWLYWALAAMMAGAARSSWVPTTSDVARYNGVGGLTLSGIISSAPDVRDTETLVRLEAHTVTRIGQTLATSGAVLVRLPRFAPVQYGDTVRVTGLLYTPAVYDTFSYADYLALRGIFSVMERATVEVDARAQANSLYSVLLAVRQDAAARINRMLPEPQAGLLVGILLGDERGLSPTLREDFAKTGTAHIIAISGFNMAVLAGVVMALLRRGEYPSRWAVAIAVLVLGLYTVLVGAGAAVVRAAVMSSVLLIGQALRRESYVPATLAFVALVMSAIEPRVLWDVSFQLSFFATLGLALFATPFNRAFGRWLLRILPRGAALLLRDLLAEPLIVSVAALIPTLPLTALYFQRVSWVQLPVNLLIVPVQAAVLISGLVGALLAWVAPPLAQIVYWFTWGLLSWTVAVIRWFAQWSWAEVTFYPLPSLVWGFLGVLIGGAILQAVQPQWLERLWAWVRLRNVLSVVLLVGVVGSGLHVALWTARADGMLHVYALDVGHSNGWLIQTPSGAHVLIDGGRFPSRLLTQLGERMPFNKRHLDAVFITQTDEFSVGALPAVLARYDVGVVFTNGQPNLSDFAQTLTDSLAGERVLPLVAGYTLDLHDGTQIEVLSPMRTPDLADPQGDSVLILRVRYGDASFLYTANASVGAQAAFLASGGNAPATVMQLPQQGTARSLAAGWLEAVQPQVILLQADAANRRGDPDPDTLAQVGDVLPLLRTDTQGIVHLWTDGSTLWHD